MAPELSPLLLHYSPLPVQAILQTCFAKKFHTQETVHYVALCVWLLLRLIRVIVRSSSLASSFHGRAALSSLLTGAGVQ